MTAQRTAPDGRGQATDATKPIVVGIDGSDASSRAVRWAAAEAALRRSPIRLVSVVPDRGQDPHDPTDFEAGYAREMLAAAYHAAAAGGVDLDIDTAVLVGSLDRTLVELSGSSELVVIGSTGIGFFAEMVLGSTAAALARRTRGPAVIIRETPRPSADPGGPVVAAIDPTAPGAAAAVHAAFAEARLHGVELVLARVLGPHPWTRFGAPEERATAAAERLLAAQRDGFPTVDTRIVPIGGSGRSVAAELTPSASLVVVGRRYADLDAIAHAMVYHARCPVLVVPSSSD